jgi:hypothetical protein
VNNSPFEVMAKESAQEIMRVCMRRLEQRYFAGIPAVADLEVVEMLDPARLTNGRVIQISSTVARWRKLRQVLILHELIHNALLHRFDDPDHDEGERFQAEVKRLWEAEAYKNLL